MTSFMRYDMQAIKITELTNLDRYRSQKINDEHNQQVFIVPTSK